MRHLLAHNLLSDCQYGFQKGRSTGDLLAFLTEPLSTSFRDFGETFPVGLDISKAFDRVWHKSLISKLPSYGFYSSLCTFISGFLSDRSIAVGDIILHFSTSYNRRSTQPELSDSRRDAIGRLTSDLSLGSDWGRVNLVLFNTSKTLFLQFFT